jgi:hypothetical protein
VRVVITTHGTSSPMVVAEDNGQLMCNRHKSSWCHHIEQVIRQGLDIESLWSMAGHADEEDDDYEGINYIQVPLVPSEGLYAEVHLRAVYNKDKWIGSYAADVIYPMERDPDFGTIETPKMGLLNPGEGRLILREMVINWFYPELEVPSHARCASKLHTVLEQSGVAQIKKGGTSKDKLMNTWTMVFYGKCIFCFKRNPDPVEEWDDDLVPRD